MGNYATNDMYVANFASETCFKSTIAGEQDSACISDATFLGTVCLGGGGNSMAAEQVSGVITKPSSGLTAGVTVLDNPATCLPVNIGGAGTILVDGAEVEIAFGQSYYDGDHR